MPAARPWRFAKEMLLQRDGAALQALQWRMARQGSFAGGQLLLVYLALCALSLGIGVAFWSFGASAVLPLAGVELLLLGAALWVCTRHAGDAETITLAARELRIEHQCGRGLETAAFRAEWVRVEPAHGEGSLVEVTGQGQRVRVGRYLRPELRMALARELRLALRRAGSGRLQHDVFLGQQR
jgi:uncharacterized membrane protein